MEKFESVDLYMDSIQNPEFKKLLEELRATIHELVPEAEETISYGMPGYKLKGYLCGFYAFKKHCSFFPGGVVEEFADKLTHFKTSKGTIQFTPENPLPYELIREILEYRIAENLKKSRK